ncbi:ATP-binding protein [Mongoliitalea daihaiensis]|uniref:ATP-binding protein n=1 Tax=Mongoliitalea daihaiensis TaxID=2782006 RepID=UPI001F47B160|nr:ATP-binding protein [Mongoliitalea daihaiensis]UJP64526.1 PAS domain-containing protein [Mongoliitalea daihaiensis]
MKKFNDPILQALPFPLWEEDFSEIKSLLITEGVWGLGSFDFKEKLQSNAELVQACMQRLNIIHVNEACLKLYQIDTVEALDQFFLKNFATHFQESFIEELLQLNEGKKEFNVISRLSTFEKTWKSIRLDFVVMEEDLKRVIVQITDISKEVEAKNHIESLVIRNQMALKTTGASAWEWDFITDEVFWSDEYYALFGIDASQSKYGYPEWLEKIHVDDRSAVVESLNQALQTKTEYWEMEYRMSIPSNKYIYVRDRGTIILNKEGERVKMIGAVHDITEEKNNLNQLIQQNKFIEAVLENIPMGVAANFIDSGKVKLMNQNFTKIYGWSKEELTDVQTFFNNVYPNEEYREEIKEKILADIASGDLDRMKWQGIEITTKAGQKRMVSATNFSLPDENLMISTVIDETDLYKANKELEQFAYIASHDLQEPLRMISGFLSLLEKKYQHQLDEKALSYIKFAVDGSNRMKEMINNLLTYARVSKKPEKADYLTITEVIEDTLEMLQVLIKENQANITYNQTLPVVKYPKSLLIQIFQNLLTNAIQNKREGISPRVHIDAVTTEKAIVFEVKDNGQGIPIEKQESVFQLFQSYGSNGSVKKRGIGLAICKKIIEKSGGKIWVTSDGKTGSSFFFSIDHSY